MSSNKVNKNNQYRNKKNSYKKKNKKKLIAISTIIMLILGITIFTLTTPVFNITNIEIEGNKKVETETILSLSNIKKGENLFRINKSKVIAAMKEDKYIDSVKITRKVPNTIKIIVQERIVKYQINLINSYAYIDQNGYILENSTIKAEVPILVGLEINENEMLNKERLGEKDLVKLNDIYQIMESAKSVNIDTLITEINTENQEEYILYLESKSKRIYIGNTTNLTNKMLYIQKIIEKEEGKSGIIFINGDLSSGFKPYFREDV